MALTEVEIDRRVDHHPPSGKKVQAHETWRARVKLMINTANALLPDGREKSLTFTALEEALMWGNAAIARNCDEDEEPS